MKISIVNACSDLGVHIDGSNIGPKKLEDIIKNEDIYTVEKEDVKKEKDKKNKRKNIKYLNEFNERLYKCIKNINDSFVITIGGDHSIAIASSLASKKKHGNIGIIWIDSHADFHSFDTTISGNIHGMPFATVCGENGNELSCFFDGEYFDPKTSVLVGARDVESPEYTNLERAGVKVFTTDDIKEQGTEKIIEEALKIAGNNTEGIHISYDIDVIDPKIAPGVSIKAKDGINKDEAIEILDCILNNREHIKSFDLVELNPLYDINDKTFNIAKEILEKIIKEIKKD